MLIAVLAALAAAASFAGAGILQQRAASQRPDDEALSPRLLTDLARRPMWLAGIGLAVLSYAFQGLALAFGPLSLVQPLIVTELIFALPVAARLNNVRMRARDWLGALAVAGGLAVAIVAASPSGGESGAPLSSWLWFLVAAGGLVALVLLLGRRLTGPVRATLYALAGGSVMGIQSGLFDTTVDNLQKGFVPLFTAWQTYLLVIASIGGLLLIQSAFNSGPLSASMPVLDAVEPAVAIVIAVVLFGEQLADGWNLVIAGAGAVVVLIGIVVLDTSPVTHRMHDQDEAGREEAAEGHEERSSA